MTIRPSIAPGATTEEASGTTRPTPGSGEPQGAFVTLECEPFYRVSNYHRTPPFLMSLASDTDLWMFIASSGGLTAGRRDPDGALFPYETEDKLYDGHHHTGPITRLRVQRAGREALEWAPFSSQTDHDARIERNLYKHVVGNQLVFEEIHHGLRLAFRYRWAGCDALGLVRTATLENFGVLGATVAVLDGLRNVLPCGAPLTLYQHSSCLVDAYKRVDLEPATSLAIYSLTSRITDRPEAGEQLRANTIWSHGLAGAKVSLSLAALDAFHRGAPVASERVRTGGRGNYLLTASLELGVGERATWHVVADVGRSHVEIAALRAGALAHADRGALIEASLAESRENLERNVASADGLQFTAHAESTAHHFANVLFNNMRGGVFAANGDVPRADLIAFMCSRNRSVAKRNERALQALPASLATSELLAVMRAHEDPDLERVCHEYLPIHFGRRHGDPSRPWNRFSIQLRYADGSAALHYQGNWRDIFQNWEALAASFPSYLPHMIAKFVNASTVDGFNPYRITRDGVDWEVADPDDPWSHIGYWGDHQIVYLLRFLEALEAHAPGALEDMLARAIFSYADVPYRLKPYAAMVANPRATIDYDTERAGRIDERVAANGSDGRLVHDEAGAVHHVNLLEKLLVPVLAKLSCFVPAGGIWMNTQRPEWNDANNALAGYGVSVVTLFHLRRHLKFIEQRLATMPVTRMTISSDVATWLESVAAAFVSHPAAVPADATGDRARKQQMDALGKAFADYRERVYTRGFDGKAEVSGRDVAEFCRQALEHVDQAIRANRRDDGLYHAYNLLAFDADGEGASLQRLDVMLEGQVAALGSGLVDPEEAVQMIEQMFASPLYRPDQRSFLLYPEKVLPGFLERNVVPDERVIAVPLLRALLAEGEDSIIARGARGTCRFQGDLSNAADLGRALDRLASEARWSQRVASDRGAVLEVFEAVFRHHAFTGRSGAMYAYEGLGSVYWHMVAKLLLAVQELALQAARESAGSPSSRSLADAYRRIRSGLCFEKTVAEYGAIPTDPYSHTPPHSGARQPGMTGQVKEGILARFGELGVRVEAGVVAFRPVLLERREFMRERSTVEFCALDGSTRPVDLPVNALAFSLCQVPVVYELTRGEAWTRITRSDGTSAKQAGDQLDLATSQTLFARRGEIARIDVGVPEHLITH